MTKKELKKQFFEISPDVIFHLAAESQFIDQLIIQKFLLKVIFLNV